MFSRYLNPVAHRWQQEWQYRATHEIRTGIRDWLTDDEFHTLLRAFAKSILDNICSAKPSASVVLEKSPNHVEAIPLIRRCFPEARFIHLIRDPRAVVSSFRAAERRWGSHWAARGIATVSMIWRHTVECGRSAADSQGRMVELRYEDLLAEPTNELRNLFDWLGLSVDLHTAEEYVEACRIDRMRKQHEDKPNTPHSLVPTRHTREFFYRGTARGWIKDLTRSQIILIERITGDLMEELGYRREYPARSKCLGLWHVHLKYLVQGIRWRMDRHLECLDDAL